MRNPIYVVDNFITLYFVIYLIFSDFLNLKTLVAFNVFRVLRILNFIEYMKIINILIRRNALDFFFSYILLTVCIIIFSFLGLNLFHTNIEDFNENNNIFNFQSFFNSFATVFNLITFENWYKIFVEFSEIKGTSNLVPKIYFIFVIFLGNYIFFHFFLVIFLNSFESLKKIDLEEIDDYETKEAIQNNLKGKIKTQINRKNKEEIGFFSISVGEEEEEEDENDEEYLEKKNSKKKLKKKISFCPSPAKRSYKSFDLFKEIFYSENSLYLFTNESFFRYLCQIISKNNIFDKSVYVFIIGSTVKLTIETFFDKKDDKLIDQKMILLKNISIYMSFLINIFFTFVIIVKVIAIGFIFSTTNFCQDKLNIVNLLAIIGFYLNLIFKEIKEFQIFFEVKIKKIYCIYLSF